MIFYTPASTNMQFPPKC